MARGVEKNSNETCVSVIGISNSSTDCSKTSRGSKKVLDWLKNLIDSCPWMVRRPLICAHGNATVKKWLQNDTPMAEIICPDCNFHDLGPVYADPDTWIEHLP
jgi:hypothetical protein